MCVIFFSSCSKTDGGRMYFYQATQSSVLQSKAVDWLYCQFHAYTAASRHVRVQCQCRRMRQLGSVAASTRILHHTQLQTHNTTMNTFTRQKYCTARNRDRQGRQIYTHNENQTQNNNLTVNVKLEETPHLLYRVTRL